MQDELAVRFELTGGFIKNAILSALSIAVSRDGDNPVVSQKDLLQGANLQLRGRLRMKDFDRRVIPNAGLDEVVVEESIMKQLKQIVQFEKARSEQMSRSCFRAGLTAALPCMQVYPVWAVGLCQAQPQGIDSPAPRPAGHRQDAGGRSHRL